MKKKLVAFAVTAAMVITSAVPALAWEATGDKVPETNEVVISSNNLKDGIVENYNNVAIHDGDEYSITVDMNRRVGDYEFLLNLAGNEGQSWTKQMSIHEDGFVFIGTDTSVGYRPVGITTFTWKFDFSHPGQKYVSLLINDHGTYGIEKEIVIELDKEVQYVTSTAFNAWDVPGTAQTSLADGEYAVVYQNQVPDEVTGVEVVLADENGEPLLDKYGEVQVVTQPVIDESYCVNSITLNDGTVIGRDNMEKYVKFNWELVKRDGTIMTNAAGQKGWNGDGFDVIQSYEGAYVILTVSGNGTSGIFGETVWGEDADSLAIQQRIAGEDRYETAMKVADQMKPKAGFSTIFVATGTNYADALSVTALADQQNAPILLVNAAHEDEVVQYIKENVASYKASVYIVGGTSVVSADFEKALKKLTVDVDRIAGVDRYETNIEVLKAFDDPESAGGIGVDGDMFTILVASGTDYPDALSAAATGNPVLLVGDELTKAQRTYLYELGSESDQRDYVVIGGRDAVSDTVKDEIAENAYKAKSVTRIGGVNRYETNMMVMDKYVNDDAAKYVFVASGMDYPDALTGGVLAAQNNAPLVLVNANVTDPASDIVDVVADNADYAGLVVIGGENAVSNATVQKIA